MQTCDSKVETPDAMITCRQSRIKSNYLHNTTMITLINKNNNNVWHFRFQKISILHCSIFYECFCWYEAESNMHTK